MTPRTVCPTFPEGYLTEQQPLLNWLDVLQQFAQAKNYWLVTVRPNGHPHTVPKWGVWLDEHFYFDGSPQTRHARNLLSNSAVCVHLESGEQVFILEGIGTALLHPAPELAAQIASAYTAKYAPYGYAPQPDQWNEGGLYRVVPQQVLAWHGLMQNPTKFLFDDLSQ